MATETKRKYALMKLGTGDWLLPSNDAQTIYRLTKYEDGPSHGVMDWDRDRDLWNVSYWDAPPETLESITEEEESPWCGRWVSFATTETRREAIEVALADGEGSP